MPSNANPKALKTPQSQIPEHDPSGQRREEALATVISSQDLLKFGHVGAHVRLSVVCKLDGFGSSDYPMVPFMRVRYS